MGKRNLETAIASLPSSVASSVSVGWKPFFLRPNMPPDGVEKGPGNRVGDRLKRAGAQVGIDFTGLTDRYPNTVKARPSVHLQVLLPPAPSLPPGSLPRPLTTQFFYSTSAQAGLEERRRIARGREDL